VSGAAEFNIDNCCKTRVFGVSYTLGYMDYDMYEIVTANVDFASTLSQLWKDTFAQAYVDVHTAENIQAYCEDNFSIERAISDLNDDRIICKIAKLDDVAVGFYLLKQHSSPVGLDENATELKQIYILSDHFGKGLGKMLYEDALRAVEQNGSSHIWLCVSDINFRAQSFYNKLAFKALGKGPTFEVGTDKLTSTIMARDI